MPPVDKLNIFSTDCRFFARTPTVSNEFEYATTPHREIIPYDGFRPYIPQYAAGRRTDPPVSVPNALKVLRDVSN